MNTRTFWVVVAAVLAVVVTGIAVMPAGAQSGGGDTYVHEVGPLIMAEDGQVCAEQISENVNKVTLTNTTHFETTFHHYEGPNGDVEIDVPKLHSDWIVLYTNGSNPTVNALAMTQEGCTAPGQDLDCHLVLDEYNITTTVKTPEGVSIDTGFDEAEVRPRPSDNVRTDCLGLSAGEIASGDVPTDQVGDAVDGVTGGPTDGVDAPVSTSTDESVDAPSADTPSSVDELLGGVPSPPDSVIDVPDTMQIQDAGSDDEDSVTDAVDDTVSTVESTVDSVT